MDTHDNGWVDDTLAALTTDPAWQPDESRGFDRLVVADAARRRRRRTITMASAGVMAGGVALMAFPASRLIAQRCIDACVNQAAQVGGFFGTGEPPPTPPVVDAGLIGTMAPDFTLEDASGAPVSLSEFRGQVVLLNFWATWCKPCLVETPWFVEFHQKYAGDGLVVIGVSLDAAGWTAVRPFIAEQDVDYPVVIGNDDLMAAYGHLAALPATFIVDRFGRISSIHTGLLSKDAQEGAIRAALARDVPGVDPQGLDQMHK